MFFSFCQFRVHPIQCTGIFSGFVVNIDVFCILVDFDTQRLAQIFLFRPDNEIRFFFLAFFPQSYFLDFRSVDVKNCCVRIFQTLHVVTRNPINCFLFKIYIQFQVQVFGMDFIGVGERMGIVTDDSAVVGFVLIQRFCIVVATGYKKGECSNAEQVL
ncbi:hypothetical protein D3C86_1221600 [compost metagenome]